MESGWSKCWKMGGRDVKRYIRIVIFSLNDGTYLVLWGYLFWIRTFVAFSCIFCSLFSAYSSCFILANFSLFVWASLEYWFGRFSFRRAVNSFTYFFSTFPLPYMEFYIGLYWLFCTGRKPGIQNKCMVQAVPGGMNFDPVKCSKEARSRGPKWLWN